MDRLIAFSNAFLSYLLLFCIIVVLSIGAIFLGIALRKKKDRKMETKQGDLAEQVLPDDGQTAQDMAKNITDKRDLVENNLAGQAGVTKTTGEQDAARRVKR